MAEAAVRKAPSGFIAGPVYDTVFLIAAPLVGLLVFVPFGYFSILNEPFQEQRFGQTLAEGFIAAVIFAHLFLVFFRSHLNAEIFAQYRFRFVAVPILLFAAMTFSNWALVVIAVVAVWWDVYHSALQTFGIGRIYDLRQGNDLEVGRGLDRVWNVLMYAGPILAGASLLAHLEEFHRFEEVEAALFTRVPAYAVQNSEYLTAAVLAFGVPFTAYYVFHYWQFRRQGYKVSFQKVFLYVILGSVSVFCWGFNSFGEGFFVMNFFHALQYFFIVWHTEGANITRRFGLGGVEFGRYIALALFVGIGVSVGIWSTGAWPDLVPPDRIFQSLLLAVAILHFWYDGFIWSVRRGQVS